MTRSLDFNGEAGMPGVGGTTGQRSSGGMQLGARGKALSHPFPLSLAPPQPAGVYTPLGRGLQTRGFVLSGSVQSQFQGRALRPEGRGEGRRGCSGGAGWGAERQVSRAGGRSETRKPRARGGRAACGTEADAGYSLTGRTQPRGLGRPPAGGLPGNPSFSARPGSLGSPF